MFEGYDLYDYYKLFRDRQGKDRSRELALRLEEAMKKNIDAEKLLDALHKHYKENDLVQNSIMDECCMIVIRMMQEGEEEATACT